MKKQTIKPKDGDTYIIENYDGELELIVDVPKPIKNIRFIFPEDPVGGSKISIYTTEDIKKVITVGEFEQPFTTLKYGNISFVRCPVGNHYLVTGINETPDKNRSVWYKLKKFITTLRRS